MTRLAIMLLAVCGCDRTPPRERAIAEVKQILTRDVDALVTSARALRDAAPRAPWQAEDLARMRAHWAEARDAYERIEGAVATLFAHLDRSVDGRYDAFVELAPDDDLFDGEGVTGMHAVERILWANAHPAETVRFESALSGYVPARVPANADEASRFRDGLVGRLVSDCEQMQRDLAPLALDPAAAYRGVMGSIEEQVEKVMLAATGEDESRYSRRTLADMRANLAGGRAIFAAIEPWLKSVDGEDEVRRVHAAFDELERAYSGSSDALPPVPEGWNPDRPNEDTPYGRLFMIVSHHADPDADGAFGAMRDAAQKLGIAVL